MGSTPAAPTTRASTRNPALRTVRRGLAARRTRRLGALLLGCTDSLTGPYPAPPGLRRALHSARKPEGWDFQILWHSLTRNRDRGPPELGEDPGGVGGAEGEEGLAYPAAGAEPPALLQKHFLPTLSTSPAEILHRATVGRS